MDVLSYQKQPSNLNGKELGEINEKISYPQASETKRL